MGRPGIIHDRRPKWLATTGRLVQKFDIFTVQCRHLTKCVGILHDRMPNCEPVSWTWMRPQVPGLTTERSFVSQATWVIDVLGLFFCHDINGCLYDQALAGVRLTGAGIRCPYYSVYLLAPGVEDHFYG